jgi:hypothetical protein
VVKVRMKFAPYEAEVLARRLGVDADDTEAIGAAFGDWLNEEPPLDESDNDIRRAREVEAEHLEQARRARLVRLSRERAAAGFGAPTRSARKGGRVFYGGRELGR